MISYDYNFINQNLNLDISKLRLKFPDKSFEIDQIECRKRFSSKLPDFINNRDFLFPSVLSGEQATNQEVAKFNSSIIPTNKTTLDLTAGLGIDVFYISKISDKTYAIDIDTNKVECLRHNLKCLNINNVTCICEDSIKFIKETDLKADVIFVDPTRRSKDGSRIYSLRETQPDIISNWEYLNAIASTIIIKASPMLDIKEAYNIVPALRAVYVVCYKGECKEVLTVSGNHPFAGICAVDIDHDSINKFIIEFDHENKKEINYCSDNAINLDKEIYLYMPNAAIMKIGCWGLLCEQFNIKKLSKDCHLFTGETLQNNFPGKIFKIENILNKNDLKNLKGSHFNVISRNYPLTAPEIEKKYKLKSGGIQYIIGCRIGLKPQLLLAKQL